MYLKKTKIEQCYSEYNELQKEFGYDPEEDDRFETIGVGDSDYTGVEPMNIDALINILTDLKTKGSTHVELAFNEDHQEYKIVGSKITLAEQAEIDELLKREEKEFLKRQEIKKLYDEIHKIKYS